MKLREAYRAYGERIMKWAYRDQIRWTIVAGCINLVLFMMIALILLGVFGR